MNGIRLLLKSVLIASLCRETTVSAWAQGSLTPPGAPAPTFRTLTEVEPRIPITNIPFTITQPGSYYLTRSLSAGSTANGIIVQAPNVTIDLMGFGLTGSNTALGISLASLGQCTVQNGKLCDWGWAIYAHGIDRCTIRNLQIDHCGSGIEVGEYSVIEDCQILGGRSVPGNHFYGIRMDYYSIVRRCMIGNNFGAAGSLTYAIYGGADASVVDCQLFNNASFDGRPAYGIRLGANSLVSGCTVRNGHMEGIHVSYAGKIESCVSVLNVTGIKADLDTLIDRCTTSFCSSNGIWVDNHCQIVDCNVSDNSFQGILANGNGNRIVNNVCASNASSGIFIFSDDNRVEGNHIFANDYGIYLRYWGEADKADRNLVLRNSAHQNRSENYHVGSGNFVAPIDSTGAFTSDSANYSF
ncbi:MAG: hypothetical protein A2X46_05715 [Lentisphaerae bacterium GWF2_57_35]|nr:MAG: hypothetical protein A2X46_05715 [Lentisphaerae bacterium GWF2_57_35]